MSFPEAIDLRRVRMPRISGISLRPRIAKLHRPSRSTLLLSLLVLAAVTAAGYMVVRSSSLVAVKEVRIVGLSGHYNKDARSAVVAEAMQMTTMNFDATKVEEAASTFVNVAGVRVETDFPHGATIYMQVRRPVLVARLNGRTVTVSQDGEVITAAGSIAGLPRIEASGDVVDGRVTGGKALSAVRLLGAAPDVLMRKVDGIKWGRYGIVVSMTKGPDLYFGTSADARLKWRDAATVLASAAAKGAAYIDLRVLGRPAVGGLGAAPSTVTGQPIVEEKPESAVTADPAPADATAIEAPAETQAPATQTAPEQQAPAAPPVQQAPAPAAGGAGVNG